jgi:hypothetical protein
VLKNEESLRVTEASPFNHFWAYDHSKVVQVRGGRSCYIKNFPSQPPSKFIWTTLEWLQDQKGWGVGPVIFAIISGRKKLL